MFFVLSKVFYTFVAPSNFCLILIGSGLLAMLRERWQRAGWRLAVTGFVLLLVFGFSPLGKLISKPLEAQFASAELPPAHAVTHIVVLGGAEQAAVSKARGQLTTNASGERVLAVPALARRYPDASVVFSGGYGWLLGEKVNATEQFAAYLVSAGVARDRILLEGESQNTWQNAIFVKDLLDGRETRCPCGVLLVTSARHMPRSVGIFRRAGFDRGGWRLYPWPVDYRTQGNGGDDWMPFQYLHDGLEQVDLAVKEWIGLVAYRISGRTDTLWPAPKEINTD
ncbi:MAG: YdcF family protein [Alphaproteobacteria bacterium]|nr:YdcF family protein [Alphaproteobacteria bacterium]